MDYKERLKQYLEEDVIYSEYKSGKCDMSDFDKFCIEHCKDIECLLNEVQELKEVKALPIINKAIDDMIKNKKEYEKLNPPNGWGTYDGLLETFREMRTICEDNPDGVFDMDL